ncbi:thiol peroxidase [Dysgonomonas sp. 511]|uniref:thiol peroxidase n=1 Tax=Dysgonomonas sp. 511 TaxID=2302930 RepID=UPI0013D21565|nr:thiol peroxidase [Dysgonomonas sp. 511]NDV79064.1 thiol peroxidase [Dysgonomonas sp. 511]
MATITFKGSNVNTSGELPAKGSQAPDFSLVKTDLAELALKDLKGKKVILNIFPSLDTGTCAASVRRFNKEAAALGDTVVLAVSADLPFAAGRFCTTEGIENVHPASVFRSPEFAKNYGVLMTDGPLKGLLARSVVVIDANGKVVYTQLVGEVTEEPDYEGALKAVK